MVDTRDEYQELFDVYWPIGVGVFLVVAAVIAFALIRYRSEADDFPESTDDSKPAEGLYAAALVVIVAGLLFFTYSTTSDLGPATSGDLDPAELGAEAVDVEVTAAKWDWRFHYPEQGITERGTDAGPPTLVVPVDTPVRFRLSSIDIIHSFFIPALRFKRDAFPGRETVFALQFGEVGFEQGGGECAEYCGLEHSYMDFNVDVKAADDFQSWADRRAAEAAAAKRSDATLARRKAGA